MKQGKIREEGSRQKKEEEGQEGTIFRKVLNTLVLSALDFQSLEG